MPVDRLSKKELFFLLLMSIDKSGWQSLIVSDQHPFKLRIFKDESPAIPVAIYIWNCTHGGGPARASDEFRIQFTGEKPQAQSGEKTLVLGWHEGYGVFVGWNIHKHNEQQEAKSPSAQVKEAALKNAHLHAFAIHKRENDETVVAFRPEFLVEYIRNVESLHEYSEVPISSTELEALNKLDSLTESDIARVESGPRREVVRQIVSKYRAHDFRRRVLGAYENRCAACGLQLRLVDAAHIVPVADESSTDETNNGIALCKTHHAAFDRNLISVTPDYQWEVSQSQMAFLAQNNCGGGASEFVENLKSAIILPNDRRDYPNPSYIEQARAIRVWVG